MANRSRRAWCFTVNNPRTEPIKWDPNVIRYAIYQLEVGVSGTFHWQGYFELFNPAKLATIRKFDGLGTGHFEQRLGTRDQARDYCRKADTRVPNSDPVEFGSFGAGGQGRRTDLADACSLIKDGKTLREVSAEHPETVVKYARGLRVYRSLVLQPRDFKTECTILYGAPGVGKSHWCSVEGAGKTICWAPAMDKGAVWFDGYDGQEILVLDDYRGEISFTMLLRLLDKYPYKVPIKGDFVEFVSRQVYITTNLDPRTWYQYYGNMLAALERRVTNWLCFTGYAQYTTCTSSHNFYDLVNTQECP